MIIVESPSMNAAGACCVFFAEQTDAAFGIEHLGKLVDTNRRPRTSLDRSRTPSELPFERVKCIMLLSNWIDFSSTRRSFVIPNGPL